jgi:hypothetical protein
VKKEFVEGKAAKDCFENAMKKLFKAPKPPKHEPTKRLKKGKD